MNVRGGRAASQHGACHAAAVASRSAIRGSELAGFVGLWCIRCTYTPPHETPNPIWSTLTDDGLMTATLAIAERLEAPRLEPQHEVVGRHGATFQEDKTP